LVAGGESAERLLIERLLLLPFNNTLSAKLATSVDIGRPLSMLVAIEGENLGADGRGNFDISNTTLTNNL